MLGALAAVWIVTAAGPTIPTDAQCPSIGAPAAPLPFSPGEVLDYRIEALGIAAGQMTMRVLPPRPDKLWSVEVTAGSNSLFSKIHAMETIARSRFDPRALRPIVYREVTTEERLSRVVEVRFGDHEATISIAPEDGAPTTTSIRWTADVSDLALGVYLIRAAPLHPGQSICADVYVLNKMWRVWATVLGVEAVPTALGQFRAWHLRGMAARHDLPKKRREVHLWITDDEHRWPLVAVAVVDIGAARAIMTNAAAGDVGGSRPDAARAPTGGENAR